LPGSSEVNRVNGIIVSIDVIPTEINTLATMAAVMEEQTIMRSSIFDQPFHSSNDVIFGRFRAWIRIIIRKDHHIAESELISLIYENGHIPGVVDTTLQLDWRSDIIDPND
jgi:hypothetical protein